MASRVRRSVRRISTPTWGALGASALAAVVFGRIVFHDWVRFDDPIHVTDNPYFFPLTWGSIGHFWVAAYEGLFIPLSYMLFAAECAATRAVSGLGPAAPVDPSLFHAVSIGLHATVVVVVHRLLLRVATPGSAAAGAAFFAIHPLQVESVAWISEQRGLLAALLAFAAIERLLAWHDACAAGQRRWWTYATATLLFAAALLAKPVAVTAPMLALAWGPWRRGFAWRDAAVPLVPWVCLAILAVTATRASQPRELNDFETPVVCRPLLAGDALAFYAGKVLVPAGLCVEYGRTPQAVLADPSAILGASGVAACLGAVFAWPRLAPVRLPLALFIIPLLPVLGFTSYAFQNHSNVADRYTFMAMLGPAAGLALLIDRAAATQRLHLAVAGYVAALSLLACGQVATWRDTGTLAEQAVMVAPDVAESWVMLATQRIERGRPIDAVRAARRALDLAPSHPRGMIVLGSGLAAAGRLPEAEAAFATADALVADPRERIELETNRGRMLLDMRRDAEAAAAFAAVLEFHSGHVGARIGLAIALTRTNDVARAADLLRGVVADQPENAHAWVGLGNALFVNGAAREAAACYSRALALDPADAGTLVNRARASLAAGDPVGARHDASRAASLGYPIDEGLQTALNGRQPDERAAAP